MTMLVEIEPTRDGMRVYLHEQVADVAGGGCREALLQLDDEPEVGQLDDLDLLRREALQFASDNLPRLYAGGGDELTVAEFDQVERGVAQARAMLLRGEAPRIRQDVDAAHQDSDVDRLLQGLSLVLGAMSKFRLTGALRVNSTPS